ncbi:eukaryotic initiation factor 4A-II-like [Paramisgurnus dabryanus]|uniref:eukaryotic initiation factor 4A-II-like n=1 Tax=Paramisgurnus dabryanus TaxID=90735 RepID=UPI0031F41503
MEPDCVFEVGTNKHHSFDDMNLRVALLRGIFAYGFEKPSVIQQRAILPCIKGYGVIAQAQSGTGKTATFPISFLQKILLHRLWCWPQQIQKVVLALGDYMGATCHACIGGTNVHNDVQYPLNILSNLHWKKQTKCKAVLSRTKSDLFQKLTADTQVILLPATMPQEVLEVTTKFMSDPIRILATKEELTLEGVEAGHCVISMKH